MNQLQGMRVIHPTTIFVGNQYRRAVNVRDLTQVQQQQIYSAYEKTARQRKAMTTFKSDDRSYGFFRSQADYFCRELIMTHTLGETPGFAASTFFQDSAEDQITGRCVEDFLAAVSRHSGRDIDLQSGQHEDMDRRQGLVS
jgi:hypothetical protein